MCQHARCLEATSIPGRQDSGQPAGETRAASTRTKTPSPSGQGRSPRPCSRWRCLATAGGGMNLLPSCPHKAGTTAGSGQKARPHDLGQAWGRQRRTFGPRQCRSAAPGSAVKVRHGEPVEQGGAEREAEKKTSTAPGIALPFMAFSIVVTASTFFSRAAALSRDGCVSVARLVSNPDIRASSCATGFPKPPDARHQQRRGAPPRSWPPPRGRQR